MALESNDRSRLTRPHPLTRRTLLRAVGAGAGVYAFGGVALSACSSDDEPQSGPASGASGGTLTAALTTGLEEVFPGGDGGVVADFWAERLYRLDPLPPREELFPELAVDVPEQTSPTTHVVRLREGVTFHHGKALTAEDVAFTYQWVMDPATAHLFAPLYNMIAGIQALSDLEVEFTLTTPTVLLPSRLSLVPILPSDFNADTFALQPSGTGAYKVASATSMDRVVLERFDGYTGDLEFTYDTLEIAAVRDSNTRLAGLFTSQFKIIEDAPLSALDQLQNDEAFEVASVPSYGWSTVMFNCGRAPFDDPRVRQAVMYAVDRDALNTAGFLGTADPAWAGFVSPEHPEFVEPDVVYSYDPDRARELLTEAGYTDGGVAIDILIMSDVDYVRLQAPVIEQNLRDVGFEPNIVPAVAPGIWTTMSEGSFDVAFTSVSDASPASTGLEFLARRSFTGFVGEGLVHWTGEPATTLAGLLDSAVAAPDDATYKDFVGQALNLIQEEVPIGALLLAKQTTAWSASLQGFSPSPTLGFVLDGVSG